MAVENRCFVAALAADTHHMFLLGPTVFAVPNVMLAAAASQEKVVDRLQLWLMSVGEDETVSASIVEMRHFRHRRLLPYVQHAWCSLLCSVLLGTLPCGLGVRFLFQNALVRR